MRNITPTITTLALALAVSACGGADTTAPAPERSGNPGELVLAALDISEPALLAATPGGPDCAPIDGYAPGVEVPDLQHPHEVMPALPKPALETLTRWDIQLNKECVHQGGQWLDRDGDGIPMFGYVDISCENVAGYSWRSTIDARVKITDLDDTMPLGSYALTWDHLEVIQVPLHEGQLQRTRTLDGEMILTRTLDGSVSLSQSYELAQYTGVADTRTFETWTGDGTWAYRPDAPTERTSGTWTHDGTWGYLRGDMFTMVNAYTAPSLHRSVACAEQAPDLGGWDGGAFEVETDTLVRVAFPKCGEAVVTVDGEPVE